MVELASTKSNKSDETINPMRFMIGL